MLVRAIEYGSVMTEPGCQANNKMGSILLHPVEIQLSPVYVTDTTEVIYFNGKK